MDGSGKCPHLVTGQIIRQTSLQRKDSRSQWRVLFEVHKLFREKGEDYGIRYLLFYLFIELSSFSWLNSIKLIMNFHGVWHLQTADCRLHAHLGLKSALVSLNFSQVSLNSTQVSCLQLAFENGNGKCELYFKSLQSAVCKCQKWSLGARAGP